MIRIRVRRRTLGVVGFVVTSLVAGAVATSTSAAPEASPQPLAFGAYTQPRGGQSERQAVEALEAQIGRQLEVVRVFETWDQDFPDSYHTWLKNSDHSIILSVKPTRNNGSAVGWWNIANAAPGSQVDNEMRSWARRIRDYGVPLRVTLHHEPESGNNGTAENYIAAWRKWVDVFQEEGADNVEFMWIMTDYAFWVNPNDRRYAPKWYPGDSWVDSIAADAYNWYDCRTGINTAWKSLEQIIRPLRDFGAEHPDKPIWLTEFASHQDARRPGWFDDARALFKQPGWEQFDGVIYFNRNGKFECDWWVDGDAATLDRYRAMAQDPFYAGAAYQDDGDPPTTTTTTTTTTIPPAGCTVEWEGSTATLRWGATGGTNVIRRNGSWLATPPAGTNVYVDGGAPVPSEYLIRVWSGAGPVDIPCTGSVPGTTTTTTTTTTIAPPGGGTALLVVRTSSLLAGDVAARDRLAAAGYAVRVLDDDGDVSPSVSEDVVVISSSVSSGKIGDTYRQTAVPVVIYKPWLYDDMGMASSYGTSSGNSVTITDPGSPLAAGRSGTTSITDGSGPIGWGDPAGSADVIATTSGNPVLFAYEAGDQLVGGGTAAACRVAVPFSHTTLAGSTDDGTALLDAAIAWAGSC